MRIAVDAMGGDYAPENIIEGVKLAADRYAKVERFYLVGDESRIKGLVDQQCSNIDLNVHGHPVDLVLRELALFKYQIGNKKQAMKYISRSLKAFNLGASEISVFLKEVSQIHHDFIHERLKSDDEYFLQLNNNPFIQKTRKSRIDLPFFERVRYFSLY